jgi:Tol biopolymer transport system component
MDADGANQSLLIDDGSSDSQAVVNPANPQKIAYVSQVGPHPQILLRDFGANTTTNLSAVVDPDVPLNGAGSDETKPDWTPLGGRLVFQTTRQGNPKIWTMKSDGAGQADLLINDGTNSEIDPVVSPDGIAYSSRGPNSGDVFDAQLVPMQQSMNGPAATPNDLTAQGSSASDLQPSWQPIAGPDPQVPEAAWAIALPASALVVAGGFLYLRRRSTAAPSAS